MSDKFICNTMEKISVIGAGSWGTCLAALLGEKGCDVKLWARRNELSRKIESEKENKQYLPGIKIPNNVIATSFLEEAVPSSEMIIVAVPSEFFRHVIKGIRPYHTSQIILSVTKGIEHHSGKRMSQVIKDEIPKARIAVLSGPNHAEEVSAKMPAASVVASKDMRTADAVSEALATPYFKLYRLNDVTGVEICGALKNITAIATGVCDGLGFGDNAKASIITLGLMEMNNYGRHFGAKRGTVYGLAGVGDLIATCMSKHSRNRFVGENLAKGRKMDEIKKEMHGMVAEGIATTKAVFEFSRQNNIGMPLTHQAYEVLFESKDLKQAIKDLLNFV